MAKELTDDEVRERFLRHVWVMIEYWAGENGSNVPKEYDSRKRLSGFAHSLLGAIDGTAMALPSFALAPTPHPDDKEFKRSEGEDWYPSAGEVDHDIAGGLHEHLYKVDPRAQRKAEPR